MALKLLGFLNSAMNTIIKSVIFVLRVLRFCINCAKINFIMAICNIDVTIYVNHVCFDFTGKHKLNNNGPY